MKTPFVWLMSVALAVTISSASANLVSNSGFETGDFTGWSDGGFTGVDTSSAYSGQYGAYFGVTEVPSFISQNLSTTAGSLYNLSFFLQAIIPKSASHTNTLGGFGTSFQVYWNGVLVFDLLNTDPFSYTEFGFTDLVATSSTTTLQFVYSYGEGDTVVDGGGMFPAFFNLDDVTVNAVGVPESLSSLWLMLPVTGMFLGSKLRRRPV